MLQAQVSLAFLSAVDDSIRDDILDTPLMHLFTGAPSLSKDTVLADLVALAPGFTGYAPVAMTVEDKRRNANGDYIEDFGSTHFQPSAGGGTLPETVTGYAVSALVGAVRTLMYSEFLPAPVVFVDEFTALDVAFDGYVKNLATWGGVCAVC